MSGELKISAGCVGARSKPLHVSVTPRRAMNYAAALGDNNPRYFNDADAGGIVAPPMLAVALTWPLSAEFDTWWEGAGIPAALQRRQVHYNESILWHRTIQCGEELTIRGECTSVRSHRAGTLLGITYDALDRHGEGVFTEHITGLLRGVALEGEGQGSGGCPGAPEPVGGSSTGWEQPLQIDPLAAHLYDACTDIIFPVHTSAAFARSVGLPGPVYQGTATLGLALREIVNREGGGDPAALAGVQAGFRGMVLPGTTVTLRVLDTRLEDEMKTVYFEVETPGGDRAVRNGRALLRTSDQVNT